MSHRRERKNLKKEKEYVYVGGWYHCNDGKRSWCEPMTTKRIPKKYFDEMKERMFND